MADVLDTLPLQGTKPAEAFEERDVTDGERGRVEVASKVLRPRRDMAPLVLLNCVDGQRLRYEPDHPIPFYGSAPAAAPTPRRRKRT